MHAGRWRDGWRGRRLGGADDGVPAAGGIIVCLSLAHSVATTVRDDDGGGADNGVLAALSAFSRSLGGDDGDDGGSVDDGARRQ